MPTVIRSLEILETAQMLDRRRCATDTRRVYVSLNLKGIAAMTGYFASIGTLQP